ncbi:hypothetical protein XA68_14811 [Ophiocordyceps unilateralis]|uniref:SCP domain-containing protein n=1 Tax=Ophiocordyceps unilateralis TaxID=268505 RepID=A0A2A9P829_OPHUN|nr:hypothetical protein XA68_14811 [Ophiocordyceps unilateralis]
MNKAFLLFALAAAAAAAGSDPNFWWLDEQAFESAVISTTSHYRGEYGAGLVRWNATLAAFASWYLGNYNCAFRHSGGPFGENMAFGYPTPAVSVAAWGNEGVQYDYGHPGYSPATGHFTQLVWKSTTDIGCARRWCGSQMQWLFTCYAIQGRAGALATLWREEKAYVRGRLSLGTLLGGLHVFATTSLTEKMGADCLGRAVIWCHDDLL